MSGINQVTQRAIWKFGTNWDGNENSFYEFIRDRNLVIGTSDEVPYRPNDIVLIASGFTVRALARVENTPRSITERPDLASRLVQFGIPQDEVRVTFADAMWIELKDNEQFRYLCQQGAVRVHHAQTLAMVESLIKEKNL